MPRREDARKLMDEIKKALYAVEGVLDLVVRYNDQEGQEIYNKSLEQLGFMVADSCCKMGRIQYNIIDEPY